MSDIHVAPETVPTPEVGPEMSSIARMFAVIWSPRKAFESVVRRPTFLLPLLFQIVFSSAVGYILYKPVIVPYQQQMMEIKRPDMSADQRALVEKQMLSPVALAVAGVFGGIGVGLGLLLWAGILYFVFTLLSSGRADFRSVFAVTVYAGMIGIVHSLVLVPMMLAKGSPEVALGPAVLIDWPEPMTFVFALLKGLDVFTIWGWAVAAVGIAVLYRKPQTPTMVKVGVVFLVWVLCQAVLGGVVHFGS